MDFYFYKVFNLILQSAKKIFLNLKQVYREFLPDFIAIYLLEKKFPDLKLKCNTKC